MNSPEDLLQVVREIHKQLDELEVKPDATCIHIVNDNGSDFFTVDPTAARPLAVISQPVFFGQQETDAHSGRSRAIQT